MHNAEWSWRTWRLNLANRDQFKAFVPQF
jgi:hypothetical protein